MQRMHQALNDLQITGQVRYVIPYAQAAKYRYLEAYKSELSQA